MAIITIENIKLRQGRTNRRGYPKAQWAAELSQVLGAAKLKAEI